MCGSTKYLSFNIISVRFPFLVSIYMLLRIYLLNQVFISVQCILTLQFKCYYRIWIINIHYNTVFYLTYKYDVLSKSFCSYSTCR